jgi:hypothetical protein
MNAFAWPSYDWFQSMVNGTGDFAGLANARTWLRPLHTALYDPEGWPATPVPERLDPVAYFRRFAALAHAQHWTVVITPNASLVSVPGARCVAREGESTFDAYVRCDIVGEAARYSDIVETQAQHLESDPAAYRSFVARTAAQARAANPGVRVIAGLTTGHRYTAPQMFAAWSSVRDLVDGYYLSIGGNERLGVALRFLRMLPDAPPAPSESN